MKDDPEASEKFVLLKRALAVGKTEGVLKMSWPFTER